MSYRGHSRSRGSYNNDNYNSHMNYGNNNNNSRQNNGSHVPNNNFYSKVNDFNDKNKAWVEIQGWTNATKENLISFISRKTNIGLRDVQVNGETIIASVISEKDANYLKSFSGIRFAGNALRISVVPGVNAVTGNAGTPSGTVSTVKLLTGFLERRFNAQNRLLDFTNMAGDMELAQSGLFAANFGKMFSALMTLAEREPFASGVDSLILAENNIMDGASISSICQTFPFLKNLSLASNQITRLKSLDNFKHKFNSLRELILMGNPIVGDPGYKAEMLRLFPRLVLLDAQPIRDENKLKEIWRFPLPRTQFFFENPQIQGLATDFISNYLNFWDNDRNQLLPLYTPDSQFSISVDTSAPFLSSNIDNSFQDKNNAPWGYYLPNSRNLTRITSTHVVQSRLAKGQERIASFFKNSPKTKHSLSTNPEKFSTDAWKVTDQAIMIVLRGEFEEVAAPENFKSTPDAPPKGPRRYNTTKLSHGNNATALSVRSFDRSWLVVSSGNSFVIASDLLTIKPYAGIEAWNPSVDKATGAAGMVVQPPVTANPSAVPPPVNGGLPVPGAIPATASISTGLPLSTATSITIPPEIAAKLSPQQQELLIKVIVETKLNMNFAGLLAEQSNWDLSLALQNFHASKANIPPDAFIN